MFTDAAEARTFIKAHRYLLARGTDIYAMSKARTLVTADAILSRNPHLAKGLKAKLAPCKCERCGITLTAPESIAARVGPECMGK